MAESSIAQQARGKTFFEGRPVPLAAQYGLTNGVLGTEGCFPRLAAGRTGASFRNRTGSDKTICLLVRNEASVVLLPGQAVNWAAGKRLRAVGAVATSISSANAGWVDDKLVASVRIGDIFWLMVQGPALIQSTATNFTPDGVAIGPTTDGKGTIDGTPGIYTSGHIIGVQNLAAAGASTAPRLLVDLAMDK